MRRLWFLLFVVLVAPAGAAEKVPPIPPRPVVRIDSLMATAAGGRVMIEARGAVSSDRIPSSYRPCSGVNRRSVSRSRRSNVF